MDSRKCQTATVTPAKPGDYPFYLFWVARQRNPSRLRQGLPIVIREPGSRFADVLDGFRYRLTHPYDQVFNMSLHCNQISSGMYWKEKASLTRQT